jgi:hypothetical protein
MDVPDHRDYSWPSDADLETTARPTGAPVTKIIVPLPVPA